MLFFFTAWWFYHSFALSASDPLQLQSIDIHRAYSVDDLSPNLLQSYPVIFTKNESSVILSSFLHEKAHDPTFLQELKTIFNPAKLRNRFRNSKVFYQIHYSHDYQESLKNETYPIDGCFDNTLSDTTSLISRSFESSVSLQGALNLMANILGVDVDVGGIARVADVSEEKVICSVEPGQKLQLQASIARKKMRLHRQRKIMIVDHGSNVSELIFLDWEEIDGPVDLELVMRSLSCVTDPKILQC